MNKDQKDISKWGYKDDSPYKEEPYLDIHTPNGIIDMTGVSIPLLANNVILHPNSGLHQFDTTMVREIPLAQDGTETKRDSLVNPDLQVDVTPENQAAYDDVYNVTLNYLNSDTYLQRLIDQGYEDPEKVRDARIAGLKRTQVVDKRGDQGSLWDLYHSIPDCMQGIPSKEWKNLPDECKEEWNAWRERYNSSGSYTYPMIGDIEMDLNQIDKYKYHLANVYAHELGHNIGGYYSPKYYSEDDPLALDRELNYADDHMLNTLNENWQEAPWQEQNEIDLRETDYDWQDREDGSRRGRNIGDKRSSKGYWYPEDVTLLYDFETLDKQVLWDDERGYYLPDELYQDEGNFQQPYFPNKIPYKGKINPKFNEYLDKYTELKRLSDKLDKEGVNKFENEEWLKMRDDVTNFRNEISNMEIPGLEGKSQLPSYKKGPVHQIGSTEAYADLTGLRYWATTVVPGWTPDQEMTPEIWEKLMDQYLKDKEAGQNNLMMERMIDRYGVDGENIINIHNTVADANDEIGGDDISQTMYAKYGGSVKQSPYNKEKLALKNQDGIIADMMRNGAFLPQFKMGSEKKIETPQGNYSIKKEFDKGRNLPYINYNYKDIDDRVYYDKDDVDDSGNFPIIDIAQQIHDQKRAHNLTKNLIKKYREGEKLSYSALKHLSSLGMIPNEEVTDPNVEALTTPPPSNPEITFEDLDVNKNIKNVTLGDDKVIPIDDQIALYMAYVSGAAEGTPYEKKLKRIYDKLNRVYYQDSKKAGLNTIEYMKSLTKS